MSQNLDGHWDIITTLLQDICTSNETISFDSLSQTSLDIDKLSDEELIELREKVNEHKMNLETGKRFLETTIENVNVLVSLKQSQGNDSKFKKKDDGKIRNGRSYHTSVYNPSEPVIIGSEVVYKLRQRGSDAEWIQCEVTRVLGDGTKFEIRDPEPDENNNPGQTFKATWKDIILIPPEEEVNDLINYPYGTKVLARYPETTTFYPAEVIGTKRDRRCRLRFDGEEEVGKETEVPRKLVLPFPVK